MASSEWAMAKSREVWHGAERNIAGYAEALDVARAAGKAEADAEKYAEGFRAGMEEARRIAASSVRARTGVHRVEVAISQLPAKGAKP